MDIQKENRLHRGWLNNTYYPAKRLAKQCNRECSEKYLDFENWLKQRGATKPTDEQLVLYWED
jgi:hypothetical protein